ncbi:hypothetical protein RCT32_00830 [Escherichia coli]|nr:hypothetical protein [Escherichia coli]MDY9135990.1 hypothetical protein [Escherichia coli]MEC9839984.1 hypothetical protein [Escherichia coli]
MIYFKWAADSHHCKGISRKKILDVPTSTPGCTGSNAVCGVLTHIINDARSGEFDDCPVM